MSSGRGLATPIGIGVTGTSGINIVVVVELRSSPKLPGVDWRGLLSLFSRTLPAKMPHLATRKTFFICRTFLLRFFLFVCFAQVRPPEGIFSKKQALHIVHASAFKVTLFKKLSFFLI